MARLWGGVRMVDGPAPHNVARLDHGALPMIRKFHKFGIRCDLPYLRTLQRQFTTRQTELEWDIFSSIGPAYQDFDGKKYNPLNISSPDHVARLLFSHLKVQGNDRLQMVATEKRATTSDDVLEKYRDKHPSVGMILDYRELDKLLGTYVIPLQAWADSDSRVHTSFSVTTAATGRLSSRSPNLQNIPTKTKLGKLIRGAFISSPGNVLVSCDLSQIEMRWAAHLSEDPTMIDIFRRDQDIHDRTACEIFGRSLEEITIIKNKVEELKKGGPSLNAAEEAIYKYFIQFERLPSKTIGFGILYGQTAQGLQESILTSKDPNWTDEERRNFELKWTLQECEKIINQWYEVYNRIRDWMEMQFQRARRWGMVWDPFGRIRPVPEVYSVHKRIRAEGLRKSGNHPIQSGAQGTIKLAMAALDPISDFFNTSGVCWPLLQIHDELITECSKGLARDWADVSREEMEHATPLIVPVKSSADQAEKWIDLK